MNGLVKCGKIPVSISAAALRKSPAWISLSARKIASTSSVTFFASTSGATTSAACAVGMAKRHASKIANQPFLMDFSISFVSSARSQLTSWIALFLAPGDGPGMEKIMPVARRSSLASCPGRLQLPPQQWATRRSIHRLRSTSITSFTFTVGNTCQTQASFIRSLLSKR